MLRFEMEVINERKEFSYVLGYTYALPFFR